MKRWVIDLGCLCSLLLFLVSAALWLLSYSMEEKLDWTRLRPNWETSAPRVSYVDYHVAWARGLLDLGKQARGPLPSQPETPGVYAHPLAPSATLLAPRTPFDRMNLQVGPFQLTHCVSFLGPARFSTHDLVLPLWLFLPAAIPPYLWWRKRTKLKVQS